ncbi:MAG TPA: AI-2E family transporter [Cyclobacteriaceae bacterium]|nr:AI-2E family transporter [Cyclobacteriaceae bacterium]
MSDPTKTNRDHVAKAIEITIRLGILIFIFGWCFLIISPFVSLVMWGIILAVTVYPVFHSLEKKLKGRTTLAATLLTIFFLTLLIAPAWMLGDSLFEGVNRLRDLYQSNELVIPPPGDRVKDWPVIAKPLIEIWTLASQNLEAVMIKFAPQVKAGAAIFFSLLASTGIGILQFIGSIIIAGVFLNYAKEGGNTARKIFGRLGGKQGENFAELSEVTIRNVVKGILGVAFIQSLMAGIGFFVAGIPLAGLWTLFCLILAIVQIGVGPVAVGVLIYAWTSMDTLTASLLTVWLIIVSISDNILKPFLLGRGAPVPMLVVFLGSVGGFIASGFIGLFLGPVLLSLGYKMFIAWVDESRATPEEASSASIPNEKADS